MRVELPCGTHRFRCALYGHTQPNRNDINGVILSWARFRRYAASPKIQPATSPLVTSRRRWILELVVRFQASPGPAEATEADALGPLWEPVKKSTILDLPIDTRE